MVTSREGASEGSKVCSVEQVERKRWGMRRERKASPAVVCARQKGDACRSGLIGTGCEAGGANETRRGWHGTHGACK